MQEGSGGRTAILIIDDDEVDRLSVRRALKRAGIVGDIDEAADVAPALSALRTREYDCVFLDYELPGGNGGDLLREARREGIDVPFVLLTGRQEADLAIEMMKEGAADYLIKEAVAPNRLAAAFQRAVRLHRAEREARQATAALAESEARFRVLHETSPDGFLILEPVGSADSIEDFEVVYSNEAAAGIAKLAPGSIMGRTVCEIWPDSRSSDVFQLYVDVVRSATPRQIETRISLDGLDGWFRVTAAPLGSGLAVSYSDVTARKRAEDERERSVAVRARFYASMSHELRTPINAILGFNALLLEEIYGPLNERQREGLGRAHKAAHHLLALINDVLDFSKLEAGKVELVLEIIDVSALMMDLLETLRPMASEKGVDLILECGPLRPIVSDPVRVRQIVLNLLSNAIKFGPGAPVVIRCSAAPADGLSIEVLDQGPGIPAEHQDQIFEEFVQLPNASQGGTGLGLPISRRLARILGGDLSVLSSGPGGAFRLLLPRMAPEHGVPLAAIERSDELA
jgi:signal transduction histidine kinase